MHKHKCSIPLPRIGDKTGTGSQLSMLQMLPKKAPPVAIDTLNDAIVTGLAKDLRPLGTVKLNGFKMYAQALITFGAKYGNQKICDVIKSSTTLKDTHLTRLANNQRSKVKSVLSTAPSAPYYSFTFDLWTENKRQRHFLSLTVHFIDEDFTLQAKLLGAQEFPADLRKTTTNIREQCSKLLRLYVNEESIPAVLDHSVAVTDGGSNVIGVFATRIPCMCHKLNLILERTFSEKSMEAFPEVKGALSKVKSVVTYFKHSGLNGKLQSSLKQCVPTRWNSQITMLESYRKSATQVQELLLANKQLHRLVGLNEEVVDELISLLKPFVDISNCFSAEKSVTLDKVARKQLTLQNHLQVKDQDSEEIRNLKNCMMGHFRHYYVVDTIHYAALALNPRFKSLKKATEPQRTAAYNFIQEKISLFLSGCSVASTEEGPAPAKQRRVDSEREYESDSEPETDGADATDDEFTAYLKMRLHLDEEDKESFDVIGFWKEARQYPILRKVAFWVLAIPSSSASDERTFSATGQMISDRRSQLGGSTVCDLAILHKNV